jgi:hypothetical protein
MARRTGRSAACCAYMTGPAGLVEGLRRRLATPRRPDAALLGYEEALIARRPEAVDVIGLLTRLYDRNLPPAWVPRLWPTSRWLIARAAVVFGVADADLATIRDALAGIKLITPCAMVPPLSHLATPLASFHFVGWTETARMDLYQAVALLVHIQVRRLEIGMIARSDVFGPQLDRNLWDYLRSARLLLQYGPTTIEPALADECWDALTKVGPGPARERLLETVLAGWRRRERRAPTTLEKRRIALEILLGLRDHTIRPGGRRTGQARGGWGARRDDEAVPDPETARSRFGQLILSGRLPSPPEEAWAEGETSADYAPEDPITHVESAGGRSRPDWRSRDLATMQNLGLVHDAGTSQLFEIAEVYRLLRRSEQTPDALEEALYVLLLVEYGLEPEVIRTMPLVTGEPADPEVALDIVAGQIWVPLPVIAAAPATEIAESFRPGSPWATIPLLPPAPELLTQLGRARLRSGWKPGMRAFSAGTLPGRLQRRLQETLAAVRRPDDLVARLARSGMRWLVRADLPPVVAAEISARIDVTTRAPSAYANLSAHQVARLHARALRVLRAELAAESAHRGVPAPDLGDLDAPLGGPDRRFGSRLVPRPEAITRFVRALEARLGAWRRDARLEDLARAFNRRAVYEYLRLL